MTVTSPAAAGTDRQQVPPGFLSFWRCEGVPAVVAEAVWSDVTHVTCPPGFAVGRQPRRAVGQTRTITRSSSWVPASRAF